MPAQTRLEQELFSGGGKITLEPVPLSGLNIGKRRDPYGALIYTSHKAEYPISNEYYGEKTIRKLEKWRGEYYLAVAGGGTNIIYQLSKILPNNDLKRIRVADKDEMQLYNFDDVTRIYNMTGKTDGYRAALLMHAGECSSADATPNRERPVLPRDITIHVEHDIIGNCVRGIKERGRHFIYLSNCLFSEYTDKDGSYKTLEMITSNKNIEDGSIVFLYFTGPGGGALILEKWGDVLASEDGDAICIPKLKRFVPSPPHRDLKHYPCVFY